MHPDLLNNTIFLRYYSQWQENPTSMVFAPIAEYFRLYGMADEAIQICLVGLKQNPQLVSGHLALAKAYLDKKENEKARLHIDSVLKMIPNHEKAVELVKNYFSAPPPPKKNSAWETLTMAKIFATQGDVNKARHVYQAILKREPENQEAKNGLQSLGREAV